MAWGVLVAMVARSLYWIYPRGFDTSSVLWGAFVQRERRDRAWSEQGGSRGVGLEVLI